MQIECFEEIEAWRTARELAQMVDKITGDSAFKRDFGLRDQMRRAVTSVMSNIAEGFERGGDKEFKRFLSMAKGSAGELQTQLYIALDSDFITKAQFDELYAMARETAGLLGGFMRHLRKSLGSES